MTNIYYISKFKRIRNFNTYNYIQNSYFLLQVEKEKKRNYLKNKISLASTSNRLLIPIRNSTKDRYAASLATQYFTR